MTTMTKVDMFTSKTPNTQKGLGVYPSGKYVVLTPKNPGIVPSPQLDEFIKTLPKKDEKVVTDEEVQPKEPKTGKKIGVSLASVLYSGLGQAVNGQWGKALGFCLGESAVAITGFCLGGPLGAILGALAIKGLSIYDAVKNV